MPILMIALIALLAFGLIGFLLTAAVLCEPKKNPAAKSRQPETVSPGKPAA